MLLIEPNWYPWILKLWIFRLSKAAKTKPREPIVARAESWVQGESKGDAYIPTKWLFLKLWAKNTFSTWPPIWPPHPYRKYASISEPHVTDKNRDLYDVSRDSNWKKCPPTRRKQQPTVDSDNDFWQWFLTEVLDSRLPFRQVQQVAPSNSPT